MNVLELEILRKYFLPFYTIGGFYADMKRLCDVLEDPVRTLVDLNNDGDFNDEGEGKIYGQTAIPSGRYIVTVSMSPKLGRRLPMIHGVYGYVGIRIHGGENQYWTEGCPLVGENKKRGQLVNYDYWENYIVNLIDQATAEGKETYITIR